MNTLEPMILFYECFNYFMRIVLKLFIRLQICQLLLCITWQIGKYVYKYYCQFLYFCVLVLSELIVCCSSVEWLENHLPTIGHGPLPTQACRRHNAMLGPN